MRPMRNEDKSLERTWKCCCRCCHCRSVQLSGRRIGFKRKFYIRVVVEFDEAAVVDIDVVVAENESRREESVNLEASRATTLTWKLQTRFGKPRTSGFLKRSRNTFTHGNPNTKKIFPKWAAADNGEQSRRWVTRRELQQRWWSWYLMKHQFSFSDEPAAHFDKPSPRAGGERNMSSFLVFSSSNFHNYESFAVLLLLVVADDWREGARESEWEMRVLDATGLKTPTRVKQKIHAIFDTERHTR